MTTPEALQADARSLRYRSALRLVALVCLCSIALISNRAYAQFGYFHPTSGTTTISASFLFDAQNEFALDPWGTTGTHPTGFVGAGFQRIVANLDQQYRIVGNPYMTQATVSFSAFNMDNTPSTQDGFTFDWFYASSPPLRTGTGYASVSTPIASGTDSLMFPGTIFRVLTRPDSVNGSPTAEHESWGFRTSNLGARVSSTIGNTLEATFSPGESIIGILGPSDDTYRTALDNYTTSWTVPIWAPAYSYDGSGSLSSVEFWARCGADPSLYNYQVHAALSDLTGNMIELGSCASNWRIAITNLSSSAQVFRMEPSTHLAGQDRTNVHVGISWNATPTELSNIRSALTESAWRYYAATAGTHIIRSFALYNNANHCDDGAVINETACSFNKCDICIEPTGYCQSGGTRSVCWGNGTVEEYIDLCNGQWATPAVLAHELGHCDGDLPDEYRDPSGEMGCHESIMAHQVYDNQTSLCTARTHRATATDEVETASIFGPVVSLVGGGTWTLPDSTSGWGHLSNIPFTFDPVSVGPPMHTYRVFFQNHTIGHF